MDISWRSGAIAIKLVIIEAPTEVAIKKAMVCNSPGIRVRDARHTAPMRGLGGFLFRLSRFIPWQKARILEGCGSDLFRFGHALRSDSLV